jgi:HK97 family phage prohead protease
MGDGSAIGRQRRGSADESPWDASKAWANGAASDNPAAFYGGICAGRKAGDPATQAAHALPHHYHPGDAPNRHGVSAALGRLGGTQGLTNAAAAEAHLKAHQSAMGDMDGPGQNAPSRPSQARAQAYQGTRRGPTAEAARMEPFAATWQHRGTEIGGKQFAQLDGYASVTGIEYEMWDMFGAYGETIAPDAFDVTLAAQPDVAFLVNHKGLTMARTKNPSGDPTLILDSDPRGLHSLAYLNPERGDVHDLLIAIDDKNVTEMSFAFMLEDGLWDEEFEHFTITRCNIDRGDVSAVNYGANPYTSIGARSRQILADLGHLPAGAQRAAFDRLSAALGTSRAIPALAEDAGCGEEVARAARDYQDSLTPLDTTPKGRSVAFYETMLRL